VNVGYYITSECLDWKFPLRLLTRRGQYYPESVQYCFDICKLTVEFFEHLFGTPYPFSKLDLVLVPMVRYTAMECAGCIVFQEGMMAAQRF